jgi:hypothetical protein
MFDSWVGGEDCMGVRVAVSCFNDVNGSVVRGEWGFTFVRVRVRGFITCLAGLWVFLDSKLEG